MSKIIRLLNRLFKKSDQGNGKLNTKRYYELSDTCQIPNLDYLYEKYFGNIDNGLFVEVGAYDGEYVSNTSGLADKGWTGFYIEPVTVHYNLCRERHKNNKNIKVHKLAIGAEDREIEINIAGPISSIRSDVLNNFRQLEWSKHLFQKNSELLRDKANQITLDSFLANHGIKPYFELLVVDVEGGEYDVFKGFHIDFWKPNMIIVELHDQNSDYPFLQKECVMVSEKIVSSGYRVIYKDYSNTIFITKELYSAA